MSTARSTPAHSCSRTDGVDGKISCLGLAPYVFVPVAAVGLWAWCAPAMLSGALEFTLWTLWLLVSIWLLQRALKEVCVRVGSDGVSWRYLGFRNFLWVDVVRVRRAAVPSALHFVLRDGAVRSVLLLPFSNRQCLVSVVRSSLMSVSEPWPANVWVVVDGARLKS